MLIRRPYPEVLGQRALPSETGIPRWGCFWRVISAIPEFRFGRAYTSDNLLELYKLTCAADNWDGSHKVLEWVAGQGRQELHCFDPGKALQLSLDYMNDLLPRRSRQKLKGVQTGGWDSRNNGPCGYYDWAAPHEWVAMAKYFKRPNGGHFCLIYPEVEVFWNPDESLSLDPHIDYRLFWVGPQ